MATASFSRVKSLICLAALYLAGCASPTIVPSTGPHDPTPAALIMLLQKPPMKYEMVGPIEFVVPAGMTWDASGDVNAGFDALKELASQKGANAVLLTVPPTTFDYLAGVGYHGTQYEVPIRNNPKTVIARAIYVVQLN